MTNLKRNLFVAFTIILLCVGIILVLPGNTPAGRVVTQADSSDANVWSHRIFEGGKDGDGDGSVDRPYLIGSLGSTVGSQGATNRTHLGTPGKYCILINDINLTGTTFSPITVLAAGSTFDGNNYAINNMTLSASTNSTTSTTGSTGLFLSVSGTVKNLYINGLKITSPNNSNSYTNVAAIAATVPSGAEANFSRIFVNGTIGNYTNNYSTVTSINCAGTVVGQVMANATVLIDSCKNSAGIYGSNHLGGIVGRTLTGAIVTIHNCANTGEIYAKSTSSSSSGSGGILGCVDDSSDISISSCYNTGKITGNAGIAGLVRVNTNGYEGTANIVNCFNDSDVSSGVNSVHPAAIAVKANANSQIRGTNNWFNINRIFSNNNTTTYPIRSFSDYNGNVISDNDNIDYYYNGSFLSTYFHNSDESAVDCFADIMNNEVNDFIVLKDSDGNYYVELAALVRTNTIVFETGYNNDVPIKMYVQESEPTITLPDDPIASDNFQARLGYVFDGWEYGGTPYEAGTEFYLSTFESDQSYVNDGVATMTAVWKKQKFKIILDDSVYEHEVTYNGEEITAHDTQYFSIFSVGDTEIKLNATSNFGNAGDTFWMIKNSDSENYSVLSDISEVNLSNFVTEFGTAESFFPSFIDFYDAPDDGYYGSITLKIVSDSKMTVISVTANFVGGSNFSIVTNDETRNVYFGMPSGFSNDGTEYIEGFNLVDSKYYTCENIEIIYSPTKSLIVPCSEINNSDSDFYSQNKSDLTFGSGGIGSGTTIKVNFVKDSFKVNVTSALNGDESNDLGLLQTYDDTIHVDDTCSLNYSAPYEHLSSENNYRFVTWKILTNNGYIYDSQLPNFNNSYKVDTNWLDRYLVKDAKGNMSVNIVAEYAQLFYVYINTFDDYGNSYGSVDVNVIDGITGESSNSMPDDGWFADGSIVILHANPAEYYELSEFTGINTEKGDFYENQSTVNLQVSGDRYISAVFVLKHYNVKFVTIDKGGNNIHGTYPSMQVQGGETYEYSDFPELSVPGYQFASFSYFDESGSTVTIDDDTLLVISTEILAKNLDALGNFVITAVYTGSFKLTVGVAGGATQMGSVKVYKITDGDLVEVTDLVFFSQPDDLVIVATSNDFYEFSAWNTNDYGEYDSKQYQLLVSDLSYSKTITAKFAPASISLSGKIEKKSSGSVEIDTVDNSITVEDDNTYSTSVKVDSKIYIIASPGFGHEVKNWKINGTDVNELMKDNDNIVREGDTLVITLTSDWFNNPNAQYVLGNATLNSVVTFGFSLSFLLPIIAAVAVIILLILIFTFYFLNLRRKQRIIKKYLLADKRARAAFNQSDIIGGVRAGQNVGGVSDEAVKATYQAEKDAKKAEKEARKAEKAKKKQQK